MPPFLSVGKGQRRSAEQEVFREARGFTVEAERSGDWPARGCSDRDTTHPRSRSDKERCWSTAAQRHHTPPACRLSLGRQQPPTDHSDRHFSQTRLHSSRHNTPTAKPPPERPCFPPSSAASPSPPPLRTLERRESWKFQRFGGRASRARQNRRLVGARLWSVKQRERRFGKGSCRTEVVGVEGVGEGGGRRGG